MLLPATLLAGLCVFGSSVVDAATPTATTAASPSPAYFALKASAKPGQANASKFKDLVLGPVTGLLIGISFAQFVPEIAQRPEFFTFEKTKAAQPSANGRQYYNVLYGALQANQTYYVGMNGLYLPGSSWQSVCSLPGNSSTFPAGGFYTNTTGLQYSTNPHNPKKDHFAGWLVCNWWLNVPQLFWLDATYPTHDQPLPSDCAMIDLKILYFSDG